MKLSNIDLDELERTAVIAYHNTYGTPPEDAIQERFFVQKGIECMRFAIAKAAEDEEYA